MQQLFPLRVLRGFLSFVVSSALLIASSALGAGCVAPAASLVSWWRAEGNSVDQNGLNPGLSGGSLGFSSGEVGQAFSFDGSTAYIKVPASSSIDVGKGGSMTIEAWVKPTATGSMPIVDWSPVGAYGVHLWVDSNQALYANLVDTLGNSHPLQTPNAQIVTGAFQHIALTYDKSTGVAMLYWNGSMVAQSAVGSFNPLTSTDLFIGNRTSGAPYGPVFFTGLLDEVTLYNQALPPSDIQNIYAAGTAGKCTVPPGCSIPPLNLTGWWRAEGDAIDSTGNNNNGTLLNGTTFAPGKVGQAFSFNGVNQIVSIPDAPSLDPTTALTMEGWVYVGAYPNGVVSIVAKESQPSTIEYQLTLVNSQGHWSFQPLITVPSGWAYFPGSTAVQAQTWYHVAVTYDGVALKMYVNGILDGSTAATGAIVTGPQPLTIGGQSSGWYFNGRVDELSLYSRALSSAEIQSVYNAGGAGKCTTPMAPVIYSQPTNQIVTVGQSATFVVTAAGTQSLGYQWSFNGNAIDGATNSSLVLTNVQLPQAGSYEVQVTNSVGSVISASAILTVTTSPNCSVPPLNLTGWWRGEGDAKDYSGSNNGTLVNGATFAPGKVGQAFSFNGVNQIVQIPDAPSLDPTTALTMEGWVYVNSFPGGVVSIMAKENQPSSIEYQLTLVNSGGHWAFQPLITVPTGWAYFPGSTAVQAQTWYHVAVTYDGTALKMYVNGILDGSRVATGAIVTGPQPLTIGGQSSGWYFNGRVDEFSLYGRALSSVEIQSIYNAGTAGKCTTPVAPFVYTQPTNLTVTAGQNASFSVIAGGTQPLIYQWDFNGIPIDSATNALLVLTNVQLSQAGTYQVQITNAMGSALSTNAVLVVNPPPPCDVAPAGLVSWWPAEGTMVDSAGGNDGTSPNGIAYAHGVVGQAFSFSGSSNCVQVPNNSTLSLTNELTIELWYQDTGCPPGNYFYGLLGKQTPSGSPLAQANYGINLYLGNPSNLQVYLQDTNYPYQASLSPMPVSGVFHHVAATYQQATSEQVEVKTYVDGQLIKIAALSGNLARTLNDAPLTIGSSDPKEGFFVGLIDEPTVYARALSSSEIQNIYNAGVSGKCPTSFPVRIYSQPLDQVVTVGQAASFIVGASGSPPLSFQWAFNAIPIGGATNASLVLTNAQMVQAGTYSVLVSNLTSSTPSSNALLTVNPPPPCTPITSNLVSWWAAEGNSADSFGGNSGVISGGTTFAPGIHGQAFAFTAPNQIVSIANSPSLNPTNALSLEAWVQVNGYPSTDASIIFGKDDLGSDRQYELDILNSGGQLFFDMSIGVSGGFVSLVGTNAIQTNSWVHVAVTYDGSALSLYVNGRLDSSRFISGAIITGPAPLTIGGLGSGPWSFFGLVDELSLYNRALSLTEIQAIYNAGASGKCPAPVIPVISAQPGSQTLTVAQTASFYVVAGGTQPLAYQWFLNGNVLAGATNSSLVLTNVQRSQAGAYSLVITNSVGSTTSGVAVLTVNFPPATVNVLNVAAAQDGSVTVPILLLANGNENAIGFSLNFPPSLLSFNAAYVGSGATGAALVVNTNVTANGEIGIALSLPTGSTFMAGTQELVEVTFIAATATNPVSASLSFGDQPTRRQLSDPQAVSLAVSFTGGSVSIPAAQIEGDVSPRPNGDKAVTITDWVLVGRYAARLDYPTNASEYQRADCAPRSTLGDGAITVADWVQAGRYAAGLDPATRAGGPTNDIVGPLVSSANETKTDGNSSLPRPKGLSPRQIKLANAFLAPGQAGTVSVLLEAQGNENAVGFSLTFDPTVFTYMSATLGANATGATIDINASQASAGKLAFVLALPIGTSFSAGTKEIIQLNLSPVSAALGDYSVAFTDQPVVRQVVDPTATPLTTQFINGTLVVNPLPTLSIANEQKTITLAWPLWATNFILQEAQGALLQSASWTNVPATFGVSNSEAVVTLPLDGATKFYRLKK